MIFNDSFDEKWMQVKNSDGIILNTMQFVGSKDATKEWNSPEKAKTLFLHTNSYENFITPESLILLGRTGTGKTSILCRLLERVNNEKIPEYSFAINISYDDILNEVSTMVSDYQNVNSSTELKRLMEMYFHTRVMSYIVSSSKYDVSATEKMRKYLLQNGLSTDSDEGISSLISRALKAVRMAGKNSGKVGELARDIDAVTGVIGVFIEYGYDSALNEMRQILSNGNALLLVDTTEEYNLQDIRVLRCAKALISACFSFYNRVEKDHVYLKISLPSEIYTMLVDQLPGKQQGNTVIIQWSSKDLIRMIAIRLLESSQQNEYGKTYYILKNNIK